MHEVIDRQTAASLGLTAYFTGEPCQRGHTSPRRVVNCACKACESEKATERYRALPRDHPKVLEARRRAREWAAANPERMKQRLKDWMEKNKEHTREYRRSRRDKDNARERERAANDPEHYKREYAKVKDNPAYKAKSIARTKRWRLANPGRAKAAQRDWKTRNPDRLREYRRVRAMALRGGGKVRVGVTREVRNRGQCAACGIIHIHMEIDHIVPVARGGTNHPSNLQLLCRPCNRSKWTYDYDQWLSSQVTFPTEKFRGM